MSSDFKRSDRVGEMIQRKLAQIIQKEINDPRMPAFLTISAVKVSADLSHAKIYFTAFNSDAEKNCSILNAAASFLRTALARTITARTVPQLHFVYDKSLEYGNHLSKLIDKANQSETDESNDEQEHS